MVRKNSLEVISMQSVNKDMTIRQVLELDRGTARIMMGFGMHCLGCPHASAESLEQAGMAHGVNVEDMVKEINEYLSQQ
jgi:hybrid cluster-associated redox disulfide protein